MNPNNTAESESNQQEDFTILQRTGNFCKIYWKILFSVTWAVVLLIPFVLVHNGPETRCAYVVLLMAGYWVTESFPMAVTSLIPIILFPSLGILSTADTCACYMNDTIMVFIGGLILAIAIEHSNLHLRIALWVIKMVGCSHAKLIGGICVVTTFISMWISNTAATAMMIPIIFAILNQLEEAGIGKVFDVESSEISDLPSSELEPKPTRITRAYFLAAAYSATFGGTGTLVGTGTNLTFKGIYETIFPSAEDINFADWMIAACPQMIVNVFFTWIYLRVAFLGFLRPNSRDAEMANMGEEGEEIVNRVIQEKYKSLGPFTFHQSAVSILFLFCICLWITRQPGFVAGWAELITQISVKDSTPVIFVSILMFFIPKEPEFIYSWNDDESKRPTRSSEGLITWKVIEQKMPWSLMFLLGGGFALSKGATESCLAARIGNSLSNMNLQSPFLLLTIVCFIVGTITEFTSNVGVANLVLPVVAHMVRISHPMGSSLDYCIAMKLHPLYLMIPTTYMCSFAFRLPVGTPPNAIIAAQGHLSTKILIASGFVPSLYALVTVIIFFPTWGAWVYNTNQFPEWAKNSNDTNSGPNC